MVARAHQAMIWEGTRHVLRLRSALREFFPAALEAFEDLTAPDALELLAKAPDPASAARLTVAQITAALKRARRRSASEKARQVQAAPCAAGSWPSPRSSPPPTRPRPVLRSR